MEKVTYTEDEKPNCGIYVFHNIMGNYCSGDYYFFALTNDLALQSAIKFSEDHNKVVENNTNYTIEWDDQTDFYPLKEGYLPLNRVMIPVQK